MSSSEEIAGEAPQPAPSAAELRKTGGMLLAFICVACLVFLTFFGGPYSNWFYVVLLLGVAPTIYQLVRGQAWHVRRDRMTRPAAFRVAALEGAVSGIWTYVFVVTATGAFYQWPTAIVVSAVAGAQRYDAMIGKRLSWKRFIVGGVAFMVVMAAFVLWKTSRH